MNLRKIILTALFMAIGVLSAHLIVIPVGVAKCFPVQHLINIIASVFLVNVLIKRSECWSICRCGDMMPS